MAERMDQEQQRGAMLDDQISALEKKIGKHRAGMLLLHIIFSPFFFFFFLLVWFGLVVKGSPGRSSEPAPYPCAPGHHSL